MDFFEAAIILIGLKHLALVDDAELERQLVNLGLRVEFKTSRRIYVENKTEQFINIQWDRCDEITKIMLLGFMIFGDRWFTEISNPVCEILEEQDYRKNNPIEPFLSSN